MLIEYFGISGVGKTTIAKMHFDKMKEQEKMVEWQGYDLYNNRSWFERNLRKSIFVSAYFVKHFTWSAKLMRIFQQVKICPRDICTLWFNGIFLKSSMEKRRHLPGYFLFDEGVLQYIWAVGLRMDEGLTEIVISEIIKLFGMADKIIVVQASTSSICSRLQKRGERVRIMECDNLANRIDEMKIEAEYIINTVIKAQYIDRKYISYFDNSRKNGDC